MCFIHYYNNSHASVVYLKRNTEDVKMGPRKSRWHKGLVLTLLSALAIFTHASIRTPVKMPTPVFRLENKELVSGTLTVAHDA